MLRLDRWGDDPTSAFRPAREALVARLRCHVVRRLLLVLALLAACSSEKGDTQRACAKWRELITREEAPSDEAAGNVVSGIAAAYGDTDAGKAAARLAADIRADRDLQPGFVALSDACGF